MINDNFKPCIIIFYNYFNNGPTKAPLLLITFIIYHLSIIVYLSQRPLV